RRRARRLRHRAASAGSSADDAPECGADAASGLADRRGIRALRRCGGRRADRVSRRPARSTLSPGRAMKSLTFSDTSDPAPRLGVLAAGGEIVDVVKGVGGRWPGKCPASLVELILSGSEAWRRMADLAGSAAATHRAGEIRWYAPIPRPAKNIFCLGLN